MSEHCRSKPFIDIYSRVRRSSEDLPPHKHYYHQIILITEGCVEFNISSKHYPAAPNSFLLISNFETHSMTVLQYPYRRYVLAVNNEFASAFLKHPILLSVFLRRPDNFCNLIELDQSTARGVSEICLKMSEELKDRKALWEENIAAMIMQLLITVYRYSNGLFWPAGTSNASSLVFNIQNYISLNYHKEISLELLSKEFYISKFYLSHIFKSITGFNYKDYLIRYRLGIARDFLVNTNMSVAEICSACGYDNINHFTRIFKIYEGVSPTTYRKNAKSLLNE